MRTQHHLQNISKDISIECTCSLDAQLDPSSKVMHSMIVGVKHAQHAYLTAVHCPLGMAAIGHRRILAPSSSLNWPGG